MIIFGWLSLEEVERYARAAERGRRAERGMGRLVAIRGRVNSTQVCGSNSKYRLSHSVVVGTRTS